MFLPADRPDPFSRIDPHAGDTALGIFLGMGKADELDLLHAPIYILEVVNCQVRPFLLKVFKNKPPMTVIRLRLAAQKDRRNGKNRRIKIFFDFPVGHQREKSALVFLPASFAFFVIVQHFFRWCELRFVPVLRRANHSKEIFKVFALGETSQLRRVLQAHVEQAANPRIS